MWHPFDIMPQELAVSDELRNASPGENRHLVYGERVTRWFKDKSSTDQQWPPTVDKKPGITLSRRLAASGTAELEIRHIWQLTVAQDMAGRMTTRTDGWRSPLSWEFQQSFLTERNKSLVPSVVDSGSWRDGVLERVTKGNSGTVRKSTPAAQLASTYALMADFPRDGQASGSTGLLREALSFTPDVSLQPVPQAVRDNPLARGLTGFVLQAPSGYPADFWVNASGLVIYACYGPNRAFILEKAETLT